MAICRGVPLALGLALLGLACTESSGEGDGVVAIRGPGRVLGIVIAR